MDKLIITIAPTGSVPTRELTPHVPLSPSEIADTVQQAREQGASVAHLHARNEDGRQTNSINVFREILKGVSSRTDIVTQVSTGTRAGATVEARAEPLALEPEMASLTTGSVNFPTHAYLNDPKTIAYLAGRMRDHGIKPECEVFDVSMVHNALFLVRKGLVEPPLHFNFVMGVPGAIPAEVPHLVHLVNTIPSDSTWTLTAIGPNHARLSAVAIAMGGHVRVGLEDNIYYSYPSTGNRPLATNLNLIDRIIRLAAELGREIATPDEARNILGLGEC